MADPYAMPLSHFIEEMVKILEERTYVNDEILVKRVQTERWAEKNNEYNVVLASHNA